MPSKTPDQLLSAEDVCKILESCSKNGVRELKFAELAVSFGPAPLVAHFPAPGPEISGQNPENVIQVQTQEEEKTQEEQGLSLRQRQIAELMITDPYHAEQLMQSGELIPPGPGEMDDGDE